MTDLAATDQIFFGRTGMDPTRVEAILDDALAGMDDGELFLEYSLSEALSVRRRQAEKRQLRHRPGLRPARDCWRNHRISPIPAS